MFCAPTVDPLPMITRQSAISVGDVVSSGGRHGLVLKIDGEHFVLLPIMQSGGTQYRGDIAITEFRDMVQAGFGGLDLVVRVSRAFRVSGRNQIRIGRLSDDLLTDIRRAVGRECAASGLEAKWSACSSTSISAFENSCTRGHVTAAAPDLS